MKFAPTFVFALLLLNLSPAPVSSVMLGLSTEQLTRDASIVARGQIVDKVSKWTADRQSIVTVVTIRLAEVYKGKPAKNTLSVEYEGGQVGDTGLLVSNIRIPSVGEDVIVFLKAKKMERLTTIYNQVGNAQGQYLIDENNTARKGNMLLLDDEDRVDYDIPLEKLVEKIKRAAE